MLADADLQEHAERREDDCENDADDIHWKSPVIQWSGAAKMKAPGAGSALVCQASKA
jgi:hypothetical protein